MKHTCSTALILAMAIASWRSAPAEVFAPAPKAKAGIAQLDWLEGTWEGTDGKSRWEAIYSSPSGGAILSASKELRGERLVMIEFEHFYEKNGVVHLTPYPFGKKSVEFPMVDFDPETKQAVFENVEHDFPRLFVYTRTDADTLTIHLEGDQGEKAVEQTLELKRVPAED